MTYDHELILLIPVESVAYCVSAAQPVVMKARTEKVYQGDEWGNQIPVDFMRLPILCKLQSVGRNEFYSAAASGYRPELIFVIHAYEFYDVKQVEFEGKAYDVIRTYRRDFEEMELVCGAVAGSG